MKSTLSLLFAMPVFFGAILGSFGCMERNSEKLISDGLAFIDSGRLGPAVEMINEVVEKEPQRADAHLFLTEIYLKNGQVELAERQLGRALSTVNPNEKLLLESANLFIKHNREHEGLAFLNSNAVSEGLEPTRLTLIAQSYAQMGEFDKSKQFFNEALALDPGMAAAHLGIAQLLLLSGRRDEGIEHLMGFMQRHPKHTGPYYVQLRLHLANNDADAAVEVLNRIRVIDPDDSNAAYLLGLLYLRMDSFKETIRVVRELQSNNAEDPIAERLESLVNLNQRKYSVAAKGLVNSLKFLPDLPGYVYAGAAHYKLRDYTKAYEFLQKALMIKGSDEQASVLMAFTLYEMKKFTKCLQLANTAVKKHPENAHLHNVIGAAYIQLGNYDMANHHMTMASQLDKNLGRKFLRKSDVPLLKRENSFSNLEDVVKFEIYPKPVQSRVLIALENLSTGNFELAIKNVEQWLQDDPTKPLFYYLIAQAYKGLGQSELEMNYLMLAKASKADFVAPRLVIAKYFIENHEFEEAEREYAGIIKNVPSNVLAHLKLAGLYEMLGYQKEADELYKSVSSLDNVTAVMARAGFLFRNGRQNDAIELLSRASDKSPANPYILKSLGEALSSAGEADEAIDVFLKLDRLQPGSALPLIVSTHLMLGDIASADELVNQVLEETTCSELVYLLKANVEEQKGHLDRAEAFLLDGIHTCARTHSIKLKYGEILYKQGKYAVAEDVYDELLVENPSNIKAMFLKGVINSMAGNPEKAMRYYQRVLEWNSNYAPALNNIAFLKCSFNRECGAALPLATRAFNLMPDNHEISNTMGYIYLESNAPEKAVPFLRKALSLSPQNVDYQNMLHAALFESKEKRLNQDKL